MRRALDMLLGQIKIAKLTEVAGKALVAATVVQVFQAQLLCLSTGHSIVAVRRVLYRVKVRNKLVWVVARRSREWVEVDRGHELLNKL